MTLFALSLSSRSIVLGALCLIALLAGCSNAKQGAASGAGVGAITGLAIGSLTGDAGTGAAIGAIAGGVGGAIIGDRNRRQEESDAAESGSIRAAPAAVVEADHDRVLLARLVGRWRVSGWSEVMASDRREISGVAEGIIEQSYFLRLDMNLILDPVKEEHLTGTLLFGSEPGRGVTLSSRFSDAPSTSRFVGSSGDGGRVLTVDEVDSKVDGVRRHMVIRFLTDLEVAVDVFNAATMESTLIGSFMLVRA